MRGIWSHISSCTSKLCSDPAGLRTKEKQTPSLQPHATVLSVSSSTWATEVPGPALRPEANPRQLSRPCRLFLSLQGRLQIPTAPSFPQRPQLPPCPPGGLCLLNPPLYLWPRGGDPQTAYLHLLWGWQYPWTFASTRGLHLSPSVGE